MNVSSSLVSLLELFHIMLFRFSDLQWLIAAACVLNVAKSENQSQQTRTSRDKP